MNSIHERLDRKTEADYNEFTRLEQGFGQVHKSIAKVQKQLLRKVGFEDPTSVTPRASMTPRPSVEPPTRNISTAPATFDIDNTNKINDMIDRIKLLEDAMSQFQYAQKDRIMNMTNSIDEISDEIRTHSRMISGPTTADS